MSSLREVSEHARALATAAANDVQYAQTRIEWMRVTQLAADAERLALELESLVQN